MTKERKSNPPYLLGLLCLLPFVGLFVGIGLGGVLITVLIYGLLFHELKNNRLFDKSYAILARGALNRLVPVIDYYKLKEGRYPDSLEQLLAVDSMIMIVDPVLFRKWIKVSV